MGKQSCKAGNEARSGRSTVDIQLPATPRKKLDKIKIGDQWVTYNAKNAEHRAFIKKKQPSSAGQTRKYKNLKGNPGRKTVKVRASAVADKSGCIPTTNVGRLMNIGEKMPDIMPSSKRVNKAKMRNRADGKFAKGKRPTKKSSKQGKK